MTSSGMPYDVVGIMLLRVLPVGKRRGTCAKREQQLMSVLAVPGSEDISYDSLNRKQRGCCGIVKLKWGTLTSILFCARDVYVLKNNTRDYCK